MHTVWSPAGLLEEVGIYSLSTFNGLIHFTWDKQPVKYINTDKQATNPNSPISYVGAACGIISLTQAAQLTSNQHNQTGVKKNATFNKN